MSNQEGETNDVRFVKDGVARAIRTLRAVTAHSGRVGLASELTSRGASTTGVMLAGNWKTSRMVAHYSAGATAERGAVARRSSSSCARRSLHGWAGRVWRLAAMSGCCSSGTVKASTRSGRLRGGRPTP